MNTKQIYLELTNNSPKGAPVSGYRNKEHHKFYELYLAGKELKINYGRIGRAGKIKLILLKSQKESNKFFKRQILSKLKRGYSRALKGETLPRVKGIHPGQLRINF